MPFKLCYDSNALAPLTRMIRKTLRAAVTLACTFFRLPGSPADANRQAYCGRMGSHGVCQHMGSHATACGCMRRRRGGELTAHGRRRGAEVQSCTTAARGAHLHERRELVLAISLGTEALDDLGRVESGGAGSGAAWGEPQGPGAGRRWGLGAAAAAVALQWRARARRHLVARAPPPIAPLRSAACRPAQAAAKILLWQFRAASHLQAIVAELLVQLERHRGRAGRCTAYQGDTAAPVD